MTIKESLAKLLTNIKRPVSEYASTPEAQFFICNTELLIRLEPFHLPEITKLICSDKKLLSLFCNEYQAVSKYYHDNSIETLMDDMRNDSTDCDYYIAQIFPLADEDTIDHFIKAYNRYSSSRRNTESNLEKNEESKKRLSQKLQEKAEELETIEKCKIADENQETIKPDVDISGKNTSSRIGSLKGTITRTKNELEEITQKITKLREQLAISVRVLQRLEPAYKDANVRIQSITTSTKRLRQQAYDSVNEKNITTALIERFMSDGYLPNSFNTDMRQESFRIQLLEVIDANYYRQTIDIIASLFASGFIDIFDSPFKEYLNNHPDDLCAFFVEHYSIADIANGENTEADIWFNFIAEGSINSSNGVEHFRKYGYLWNRIALPDEWKLVLKRFNEIPSNYTDVLAKLLLSTNGTTLKTLLTIANESIESDTIDGVGSLITALIENHIPNDSCADLVCIFVDKLDSSSHMLKRTNEKNEYLLSKVPSDIYGALSEPIEALELLASNIAGNEGTISVDTISTKLRKDLIELRKGLSNLGIETVVPLAEWLAQNTIPFDSMRHSIALSTPPQSVYPRSLGFVYKSLDGSQKTHQAIVGRTQSKAKKGNPSITALPRNSRKKGGDNK